METLTFGLMAGCMAMLSRIPPPPSHIYNANRLRNCLRRLFFSGGVCNNKQPDCFRSESCNDDIIAEILSRLPVKSLLRYRAVCKSWRALISHPCFVKKHLNHAINGIDDSTKLLFLNNKSLFELHPQSLLVDSLKDFVGQSVSKELDIPGIMEVIVGSCNGLICLKDGCGGGFLWNPSTGEASKLPGQIHQITVNNPYWGDMYYGFGYDSTAEDYKVIFGDTTTSRNNVFRLKEDSWKNIESLEAEYGGISGQGCLANGALHWVERLGDDRYSSRSRIILFDLAEGKFMETPRLSFLSKKRCSQMRMGTTIRDSVYLYCVHEVVSDHVLVTIWTMEEYGVMESWSKVEIRRDGLPRDIERMVILQNGEVLMNWKAEKLAALYTV